MQKGNSDGRNSDSQEARKHQAKKEKLPKCEIVLVLDKYGYQPCAEKQIDPGDAQADTLLRGSPQRIRSNAAVHTFSDIQGATSSPTTAPLPDNPYRHAPKD